MERYNPSLVIGLICIFSCIVLFDITFRFIPRNEKDVSIRKRFKGMIFFSLSIVFWAVITFNSVFHFLANNWTSFLSMIHNVFIFSSLVYMEYSPPGLKKIGDRLSFRNHLIVNLLICLLLLVASMANYPIILTIYHYISLLTIFSFGFVVSKTFFKRKLFISGILTVVVCLIIFISQPESSLLDFIDLRFESLIKLLLISSRITLVLIIITLALSWSQLNAEQLSIKIEDFEQKFKSSNERNNDIWKRIASLTAHKLKNPVFAIETHTSAIKKRLRNHDVRGAMNSIIDSESAINEIKYLVEDFNKFSNDDLSLKKSDLIKLIYDIYGPYRLNGVKLVLNSSFLGLTEDESKKTNKSKTVHVEVFSESKTLSFFFDRRKIHECIQELFANSQKHFQWDDDVKRNLVITIQLSIVRGNQLEIVYEDNGPGVDPIHKDRIFEPFYTTNPHGSGLGLAIIKKNIDLHGGQILERGIFGKGVSFLIYLPYKI